MDITGKRAVEVLKTMEHRVALHKKDNTNKFWSYKIKSAKKSEFAFDPNTTTGLFIRFDRMPPEIPGVEQIASISGDDISTALGRVFSGGIHKANYKAVVRTEAALLALVEHMEQL